MVRIASRPDQRAQSTSRRNARTRSLLMPNLLSATSMLNGRMLDVFEVSGLVMLSSTHGTRYCEAELIIANGYCLDIKAADRGSISTKETKTRRMPRCRL